MVLHWCIMSSLKHVALTSPLCSLDSDHACPCPSFIASAIEPTCGSRVRGGFVAADAILHSNRGGRLLAQGVQCGPLGQTIATSTPVFHAARLTLASVNIVCRNGFHVLA